MTDKKKNAKEKEQPMSKLETVRAMNDCAAQLQIIERVRALQQSEKRLAEYNKLNRENYADLTKKVIELWR